MQAIFIRIIIIVSALLCGVTSRVQAQGHFVQGVVYDKQTKEPLLGVTVMFMNANNRIIGGVATGADGKFRSAVPPTTEKVGFSFIGMTAQTFPLDFQKQYEVYMEDASTTLEAVIVRGEQPKADLGLLQKNRRDMANAISSVDMKMLEAQPISSVEQLLQGAAPGLQVIFNSGDPGAGASIRIRGISTLDGSTSPLWVVDGVEVIGDDYNVSSITNFGYSPIGDIDPSDIESIDILKDASSTALYGSRGANGVIVIKTKRGRPGKPVFNISAKLTSTMVPKRLPMLNGDEQRIFAIENRANVNTGGDDGSFFPELRGDLTRKDAWMYNNNTDWVDEISRNGFQQEYNFSLRGGGERLTYYWGVGYARELGTTVGGGYERFNTMVNLDYRLSDKLKIAAKFGYTNSTTDKRSSDHPVKTADDAKRTISPIGFSRARAAYFPVFNENASDYLIVRKEKEATSWTSQYNPLAIIDRSSYLTLANRFTAAVNLSFDISKQWNFYTQVSVDYRQSGDDYFISPSAIGAVHGEDNYNYGKRADGYQMKLVNNNRLIYTPIATDQHYLNLTAVADLIYNTNNSMAVTYSNGASPWLRDADASARINDLQGSRGESSSLSLVVNAHYKFMNRYNIEASIKTEGSSLYGKDNPYSLFPTFGVAWDMSKESFFVDKEWVDLIKPRFAFGRSGRLPAVNNILSVAYGSGAGGYLGNTYTYINKFAYDNVHEERSTDLNYGLDWNLFSNRLSGEFNYYTRKTVDLLLQQAIPGSSGFTSQYVNFGTIKNQGWEIGVSGTPVDLVEKRFRWKVYFNISRNRNKLVSLPDNFLQDNYTETVEGFKSKLVPGDVVGAFYGYRSLGVYATDEDAAMRDFNGNLVYDAEGKTKKLHYGSATGHEFRGGDMIYEDINKDGLINELDMVQIGDANSDYYGMFRNDFNWKQWSLSIGLYYNLGADVINGMRRSTESMTGDDNQATSIERRWRRQGDITDMPRAERNADWNTAASSRWVEDASYLKLKELSLTYQFDKPVLQKLGLSMLSVWASGTDLLTWTKYKGIDPEIGTGGGISIFGVDRQNTAPPIRFTFGLRASF